MVHTKYELSTKEIFFFNSVRGDYFYVYIYTQHENDGEN